MNLTKLRAELIRDEGYERKVYLDSIGLKTGGIGHLLVGAEKDMAVGSSISSDTVESWFKHDVDEAVGIAVQYCEAETFNSLSEIRQRVIVNMCFNLGPRIFQFIRLRGAIKRADWAYAVICMRESKWATQVGDRAVRLMDALINNGIDI